MMSKIVQFRVQLNSHILDVPLERFAFQIFPQLLLLGHVAEIIALAKFSMVEPFVLVQPHCGKPILRKG